jgi:hypothetical protein
MNVALKLSFAHWMVGFTFDRYNLMLSVGPVTLIFANQRKYEREMENYILQQNGRGY